MYTCKEVNIKSFSSNVGRGMRTYSLTTVENKRKEIQRLEVLADLIKS